jgi:hypothetical protein
MIKGTTKTGFNFELDDDVIDDYDLLLKLAEVDAGNLAGIDGIFNEVLGKEQKNELREHIKKVTGRKRVSLKLMVASLQEIFEATNATKN